MTDDTGNNLEKTIRVLVFKGEHDEWRKWSKKFLARAKMKGYKNILLGVDKPPKQNEITEDAAKLKLRLLNEAAYNDLLLSCDDDVSFGAVEDALTDDHPDGDAAKAWQNLMAKYEPSTSGSLVLMKKEFAASKLSSVGTDPDVWIAELERMRQRLRNMKATISDDDLIIHILNNLPTEYNTIVEQLEDAISSTGDDKLTLERVRDKLRIKFQRIKKDEQGGDTIATDTALTAQSGGKFKGLCRVCGKYGHKGNDCWHNKNKGGRPDDRTPSGTNNSNPVLITVIIIMERGEQGDSMGSATSATSLDIASLNVA